MANLLDLVDSKAPVALDNVPDAVKAKWAAATTEQDHAKWLRGKLPAQSYSRSDEAPREWATKIVTEADRAVDDLCWNTFVQADQLPIPMQTRAPAVLTKLMETPRASLGDILDVAMKLGFVVLPFEYVDPKAWASEKAEMREAIQTFGRLDGGVEVRNQGYGTEQKIEHPARMDVYVVCPPIYYSLDRHIAAKNPNKPIFAGKNDQAFMALGLTLPTLRAMKAQIATLEENQRSMHQHQQQLASSVRDLQQQVVSLRENVTAQLGRMQEMIDGQIRAATEEAVEIAVRKGGEGNPEVREILAHMAGKSSLKDARAAVAALEAVVFRIEEPLQFALKPGTSLRSRTAEAVLGPCWGPDFEDIIAAAVGLKIDRDRRDEAEAMLTVWKPQQRR